MAFGTMWDENMAIPDSWDENLAGSRDIRITSFILFCIFVFLTCSCDEFA